jgi:hypothetical protein
MVPPKTDKRWELLVTGKINHNFKSVPLGMMISRHKRECNKDSSTGNVNKIIDEAYNFFQKFEKILTDDIKAIFGQE